MKRIISQSLIVSAIAVLSSVPAVAEKNDWTLSFPETKAHFVKVQLEWAKKNPHWKPTKEEFETMFDKADADKNGSLTEDEWKAHQETIKKEKNKK